MSILQPVTLEGREVRLIPLEAAHHEALCAFGLDPDLWKHTVIRVETPAEMLDYLEQALQEQAAGSALPFAITLARSGRVVGTTRYHSFHPRHHRVEIGHTWIGREWQRTVVNTESKFLLLRHAFEVLGVQRVEFRADTENEPSHRALLRIGAVREGVLRRALFSPRRGARDAVVFSIVDTEWAAVKSRLLALLAGG